LVFSLWSLVFSLWSLVFSLWSLVFGLWSLGFGLFGSLGVGGLVVMDAVQSLEFKVQPVTHHALRIVFGL